MIFIRKKKGFSLIELMVVVAILAILAIIAVPRIVNALQRARDAEAIATVTTIANALARMHIEYEKYPGENYVLEPEHSADAFFNTLTITLGSGATISVSHYMDLRNWESIVDLTYKPQMEEQGFQIDIAFRNVDGSWIITPEQIVWEDD